MTFADKVLDFYSSLAYRGKLPPNIEVIDPYSSGSAFVLATKFYKKFYNDEKQRRIILGINPGRLGAGVTGVPFTDTKRLSEECGIPVKGITSHEPSSVFIYDMIRQYGGVEKFYSDFYINSVCPVGFVINKDGKRTNYNYYDRKELLTLTRSFIIDTLREQVSFGIDAHECFCLGTGKNYRFLSDLNREIGLFGKITPLEHPRYVVQYKSKKSALYVDKYIRRFRGEP